MPTNDFSINFPAKTTKRIRNMSASKYARRNNVTATQGAASVAAGVALIPGGQPVAAVIGLGIVVANLFSGAGAIPENTLWLAAYYQYWVLGQSGVTTYKKANAIYIQPAVQWFSSFLGVPIIDITQLWALKGTNSAFQLQNLPLTTRAANYITSLKNPAIFSSAVKAATSAPINIAITAGINAPIENIELACLLSDALQTPAQLGNKGIPAYWAQVYDTQPVLVQNALSSGEIDLPPAVQAATAQTAPQPATITQAVPANPLRNILGTIGATIGIPVTNPGTGTVAQITPAAVASGVTPLAQAVAQAAAPPGTTVGNVLVPGAGSVATTATPTGLIGIVIAVIVIAYLLFK